MVVWLLVATSGTATTGAAVDGRGGVEPAEPYDNSTVTVDVSVRGEDGEPLTGLSQDDFRLSVDGRQVPITLFSAFSEQQHPEVEGGMDAGAADEAAPREPMLPTYLVLYIDNQNIRTADRNRFLRAAQEFVRTSLGSAVQVSVQVMVITSQSSKLVDIVQPFTSEPRDVVHALRGVRLTPTGLEERDEERQEIRHDIHRAGENRHHSRSSRQQEQSDILSSIYKFAVDEGAVLSESLRAMRQVFTTLTGVTGRKHIVYVSNGLPMALGAELLYRFAALSGASRRGSQAFSRSRSRQFEIVTAAANAQGITIHPVDVTGTSRLRFSLGETDSRRAAAAQAVARENQQAPLELLADRTGGRAVLNTDAFASELQRIRTAFSTYYTLGSRLEAAGSDTVHQVEVSVPGEPGGEPSYQRTFVSKSLETWVQERVTSRLFVELDANPLGIEVSRPLSLKASGDRRQLLVPVSIPVQALRMVRDGEAYVGRAVHVMALRNLGSGTMDSQREEHTFRVPVDEYEERRHETFPIYLRLLVEPGANTIVVGVLDPVTGQYAIDSIETTVEPPG
jgi:VWFA-related protein